MQRDAFPHPVDEVTRLETHISWLFFAGDHVYKVKKPVNLGFVDFTTLDLRRHYCEEEVRLNRRVPGDVHRGVVPIVRRADGRMAIDGSGPLVDWAVAMRRLPAHRMLDRLLESGEVDNSKCDALVDVLVPFHAAAATGAGVDVHGSPDAVSRVSRDNITALESRTGSVGVLTETLHRFLAGEVERALEELRPVFERRVREGRIREGHGDLHAGNICYERVVPILYDCVEFSRSLRCSDVAADVAFLAMDLDARGYLGFSRYFVRRYAERSGDEGIREVVGFYKSYRALVRAKVASLRLDEPTLTAEDREATQQEGARYARLAGAYGVTPALVLMCGLPGSGKSWLASRIDVPHDARVLRSDVVRKRLAGMPPTERGDSELGAGLYGEESTAATYGALLEEARTTLEGGRSVIVDAAFTRAEQRAPFLSMAGELPARAVTLWVDTPEAVARERLGRRADDPSEASDADERVYDWARKSFESPVAEQCGALVRVLGSEPPDQVASALLDQLVT